MTKQTSKWQSAELTSTFLNGMRGAIPGADLQMTAIIKIVEHWASQPNKILDIGCGDGILGRLLMEIYPEAHAYFLDFSEPMLAAARSKIVDSSQATIKQADFSSPEWIGVVNDEKFDIVISGFAIHHLPDNRKLALYTEIYQLLTSGGLFLNMEHVKSATPAGEKLFDDLFVDNLYKFHKNIKPEITRQEIETTFYNRPDKSENILAPVDLQCDWLREIGFTDVDCFFKIFEMALLGGRKNDK
jgi:tRNA (cmo5U34)-methyltransferase